MAAVKKPFCFIDLDELKDHLKIDATVTKFDNALIRIANAACARVEKYIDGPVLTRQFVEERDGNQSNVIVPDYFPVTEIVEIRIDYNRGFAENTIVLPENTILRGQPDMRQLSGDVDIRLDGQDILLRDAADTSTLGRLFTGSSASSIKVTYKAGRGESTEDLPDDLVYATLLLCEFMYMMRENRDLGLKAKNNGNQGYDRDFESGMPPEVTDILDQYVDYTFGHAQVPQKNNFGV